MHYISILSTIVAFAFAISVLTRYGLKKGNHLLFWGIGLILYGLGTLAEVLLAFMFNPLVLKIWYLSGAMLTAAWLGQGTVFLLIRKRGVAFGMAVGLVLISLAAIALVLSAPLTSAAVPFDVNRAVSIQYQDILTRSGVTILLTILLNTYGLLTLVGGAIYSAFIFWRKKVLGNRMLGNILIAAGALMPAMAGSLLKAGVVDLLYISELLGVVVMYYGFLKATAGKPVERKVTIASSAG